MITFVARVLHVQKIDCASNNWLIKQQKLDIGNIQRHLN